MTIAAKYEDGVFKPLPDVNPTEYTRVEVRVREACRATAISKVPPRIGGVRDAR